MTDVLQGIASTLYNFGTFMLQLMGFQLVSGKWQAPSWNDFVIRLIELITIGLVTVFMIKYVILRLL